MSDYLKGGAYTSGCVVVHFSWRLIETPFYSAASISEYEATGIFHESFYIQLTLATRTHSKKHCHRKAHHFRLNVRDWLLNMDCAHSTTSNYRVNTFGFVGLSE